MFYLFYHSGREVFLKVIMFSCFDLFEVSKEHGHQFLKSADNSICQCSDVNEKGTRKKMID